MYHTYGTDGSIGILLRAFLKDFLQYTYTLPSSCSTANSFFARDRLHPLFFVPNTKELGELLFAISSPFSYVRIKPDMRPQRAVENG